ncbi:hypothetical protein FHG87_018441 [Trinorchestia longiramus]|nr:hypothetical protein FHG87_018441 [Trinorchestia longiramus]
MKSEHSAGKQQQRASTSGRRSSTRRQNTKNLLDLEGAAGALGLMSGGSPGAICSVPPALPPALPPSHTAVDPSMTSGSGGSYLPGSFSMLSYPGGVMGGGGRAGPPTVQESGGTTYYCPAQPPTGPIPPPPSSITPTPIHQYSHTSGPSPLYPQYECFYLRIVSGQQVGLRMRLPHLRIVCGQQVGLRMRLPHLRIVSGQQVGLRMRMRMRFGLQVPRAAEAEAAELRCSLIQTRVLR